MQHDTDCGCDLIASMQEAVAIVRGETEPARIHLPPGSIDVRGIRLTTGLSRAAFAERFGLTISAVRDWKQGLRRPDSATRVLPMVIERDPDVAVAVGTDAQAA